MKKIFLAICFIVFGSVVAYAKLTEISDHSAVPQPQTQAQSETPIVHNMTNEALENFLEERIKNTVIEDSQKVTTGSIHSIRSPEAQKAMKELQKSEFQKIYEAALEKVVKPQRPADIYLPETIPQISEQRKAWEKPDFPVIEAVLPDSPEKVLIPAREHIPYLMTKIDILPNGDVKFEETITVVANGEKITNGINRSLPETILLRDGSKQNLSYTFVGATVNGISSEYKMSRNRRGYLISPISKEKLNPGVYTFRLVYLAHNLMGLYSDFDEFYWDVTGSSWNLVISKIGATITYPQAGEPLGQVVLVGTPAALSSNWGNIIKLNPTSFGYRSIRPLFVGEGFHIISSLPHGVIQEQSFSDWLFGVIEKYSDIIFSAMSLLMVVVGFVVSGRYIRRNIGQLKVSLRKTAPIMRFLYANRYDAKSFGAFILELYKKNIVDIQQSGDTILLVKRTDNLKHLSKYEQKAMQALFGVSEAVFNVNKNNLVKIRRASRFIEKETRFGMIAFQIKLNIGYIAFSLAMLFIGETFIALFADNLPIIKVLFSGTLMLFAGCLLFYLPAVRSLYNILAKAIGTALILLTLVIMSSVVSLIAVLLILVAILSIFYFTSGYTGRNGLLKPYIDDVVAVKERLRQYRDNILLGKEIANQQANILVLDMEDEFYSDRKNEYNKLNTIIEMIRKLN